MGFGWQVWRAGSFPAEKSQGMLWCGSNPLLLQLLFYLLMLDMMHTAKSSTAVRSPPVPGRRVFAELQKRTMLSVEYPHGDENNPVIKVEWRMLNMSKMILSHEVPNKTIYFGDYLKRAHYYFNNNTLILDAVRKEDEGVYQVFIIYQNTSVIVINVTLKLVAPPSPPHIRASINSSLMVLLLKCEVKEGTDLSYHWMKSSQSLPQDERHFLREENSTLQVNNLTSTDCVNYSCVAANDLGRTEEHFQLTDNTTKMCPQRSNPNNFDLRAILSIAAGVICVLGLSVIIWCVNKHYQEIRRWLRGICSKDKATESRRGQRRSQEEANVIGNPIYDGIRDIEVAPEAQEVAQIPYVYTDFVPNWHPAGRRQSAAQIEDFGYSTIGPLEIHSPPPT